MNFAWIFSSKKTWIWALGLLVSLDMHAADEVSFLPQKRIPREAPKGPLPEAIDPKRWAIFGDILFFAPYETCAEWAFFVNPAFSFKEVFHPVTPPGSYRADFIALSFDWNWGARVGVGYTMKHDQWDTQLYCTSFLTDGNSYLTAPPNESIQSQFVCSDVLLLASVFQRAGIQWDLSFNMFDWDLGRNCVLSESLLFCHYLGIKGGWIHQTMHASWMGTSISASEQFKHYFWGVGPKGGLKGKWGLGNVHNHLFSLFGDFAGAFMWGHWTFSNTLHGTRNIIIDLVDIDLTTVNRIPPRNAGALELQASTGVAWEIDLQGFHFALQLGYEMQFWFNHLQFFHDFSGDLQNTLILQGGTLRFHIDF